MKISTKEVLHVAKLAELEVPAQDVDKLARQLDSIVEYVGQLAKLGMAKDTPPFIPGPEQTPLRPDEVRAAALARRPEQMAPAFRDGLYLVPRLAAMEVE